jgi:hypothetical protein
MAVLRRLALLLLVASFPGLHAACDRGEGEPPAIIVTWAGDYREPVRPLLLEPGEVPRSFGPAALEYLLLRLSPDGERVAAIVAGYDDHHAPRLIVFGLRGGGVTVTDAEDIGDAHDLAWSPDGLHLAVVRPTRVLILDTAHWDTAAAYDARGRLFGSIDGDIWAPDSSAVALGLSDGVAVVAAGRAPVEIKFTTTPFSPRAAAFAGWFGEEVLMQDLATGVYYSHPGLGSNDGGWRATVPADPRADFLGQLERGADALYEVLRSATLSSTRHTADRRGVLLSGWQAASDVEITRGPFASVVVVAIPDEDPAVFELGKVDSFSLVQEGRLVDGVVR